ncbi:MAG: Flp family type IVb pilin [Planctomycetota bacterium]
MIHRILQLVREEDGPTAVEYAVVLALIVGVCLGSVNLLATQTGASFDNSSAQIAAALGS